MSGGTVGRREEPATAKTRQVANIDFVILRLPLDSTTLPQPASVLRALVSGLPAGHGTVTARNCTAETYALPPRIALFQTNSSNISLA